MTNDLKRQRLSTNVLVPTKTFKQQMESSLPHTESHSREKGKRKLDDTGIASNSTALVSGYPNFKDMKQIKHFIREIAIHDRTTIEVQSDGSFIVRPHPLQLPNEIITLILSHLTTAQHQKTIYECTLVTKQFHTIANPILWKTPSFSNNDRKKQFMHYLSNASEQRLAILGQHMRQFSVDHYSLTKIFFSDIIPHLSNLTHISFVGYNYITDTDFQHVLTHCRQLTSIQLKNTQLTQASFSAIGKHYPQLQHLQCYTDSQQSFDWMEFLFQCPLTSLDLGSDPFDHHSAPTQHALTTIQQFDRLTSLTLDFPFDRFDIRNVVHLATQVSPENSNNETTTPLWWPHLTSLKLSPCYSIDNTTWIGFIKARPRLQQLDLCQADELTNRTFLDMASRFPELTCMTLLGYNRINADEIREFVRESSTLERLVIDGWPTITNDDFPHFDLNLPTYDDNNYDDEVPSIVFDRKYIDMIRQGES